MTLGITDAGVLAGLAAVVDPCSAAVGAPRNLVEMGLVLGWSIEADRVRVRICLTGPGCMLVGNLMRSIDEAVRSSTGAACVEVEVDPSHLWTPAQMRAREVPPSFRLQNRRSTGSTAAC